MKKSIKKFAALLLLTGLCFSVSAQQAASVQIVSGSKTIFQDNGALEKIADEIYFRNIESFSNKTVSEFKSQVQRYTGQGTRAEKFNIDRYPTISISQQGETILLSYNFIFNSIDFRHTTPDNIVGIGTSREADPHFIIDWDMSLEFEISTNSHLDQLDASYKRLHLKKISRNQESLSVANAYFDLVRGTLRTKGDMSEWLTMEFGNYLFRVSADLAIKINDDLRRYFNEKIKNNKALLAENAIDGNDKLDLKVGPSNSLVLEHPYSSKGITARISSSNASDITQKKLDVTNSNVPTSTKASTINKGPSGTNVIIKKNGLKSKM